MNKLSDRAMFTHYDLLRCAIPAQHELQWRCCVQSESDISGVGPASVCCRRGPSLQLVHRSLQMPCIRIPGKRCQAQRKPTLRFCLANVAKRDEKVMSEKRSPTRFSWPQLRSRVRTRPSCCRDTPVSCKRCSRSEVCARPSLSYRNENSMTSRTLHAGECYALQMPVLHGGMALGGRKGGRGSIREAEKGEGRRAGGEEASCVWSQSDIVTFLRGEHQSLKPCFKDKTSGASSRCQMQHCIAMWSVRCMSRSRLTY